MVNEIIPSQINMISVKLIYSIGWESYLDVILLIGINYRPLGEGR